eukprot:jgi/Tetstr1/421168/TSEL_012211.t1
MSTAVEPSGREGATGGGLPGAGAGRCGETGGDDAATTAPPAGAEVSAGESPFPWGGEGFAVPSEEADAWVDGEVLRERQRVHGEYRRWMLANSRAAQGGSTQQGGADGDGSAAASSFGQAHHLTPSEAWEQGRKAWRARKGGYKRHLPFSASSMRDFNFEDYVLSPGREFPVPIALPDAVDMLVDIWLQDGMYDNS